MRNNGYVPDVKCPNCGWTMESSSLTCLICGYKAKLNSALTGQGKLPDSEPTVDVWKAELERNGTYSVESLREVRADFRRKKRSHKIKPIRNLIKRIRRNIRRPRTYLSLSLLVLVSIFLSLSPSQKNASYEFFGLSTSYRTQFQEGVKGFAFTQKSNSGIPFYWPGCSPITFEIRQSYATKSDLEVVDLALSEIASVYKREFQFVGETSEVDAEDIKSQILINFTSKEKSQALTETSLKVNFDPVGLGGPTLLGTSNRPLRDSTTILKGQVWIDKSGWQKSDRRTKKSIIMHEIGHVLGLNHPELKNGQVMGYNSNVYSLGTGDKLGLQILSALSKCQKMPRYLNK
jgi:hypothetical protein